MKSFQILKGFDQGNFNWKTTDFWMFSKSVQESDSGVFGSSYVNLWAVNGALNKNL